MSRLASRLDQISPFQVMELLKQADQLSAQGRDIVHMSIGEPDFTAVPDVVAAAHAAVNQGQTRYTPAMGLPMLREAIAAFQGEVFGAAVDPSRIVVTSGASGALQMACTALLNPGDEVLLADPAYPCNRHFVTAAGGVPRLVPTGPETRFQLTAELVEQHWGPRTVGVMVASPGNPTGTMITPEAMADLVAAVRVRGGFVISDEIYLGLSYTDERRSALTLGDDIIALNSFSKYFHMTGWRLGWMTVPPQWVGAFEKLAQNLVICPSAVAQYAALGNFTPASRIELEQRREAFRARRDFLVPAFERLGLHVPVVPDGAFYIYADVSRHSNDSQALAQRLLLEADVCAVPGLDFGDVDAARYMRFSYANSLERLGEAVRRMERLLLG